MSPRNIARLLAAAFSILACGQSESSSDAEPLAVAKASAPIAGHYKVRGTTIDKDTKSRRPVSGSVIVHTDGDRYSATFHLSTTLMGHGQPKRAELTGKGEGTIEGRVLHGTAETQMLFALIPGVDAAFGFAPRGGTKRLLNTSEATFDERGRVRIVIDSKPAPGEAAYSPTRTTLRGERITDEIVVDTDDV